MFSHITQKRYQSFLNFASIFAFFSPQGRLRSFFFAEIVHMPVIPFRILYNISLLFLY